MCLPDSHLYDFIYFHLIYVEHTFLFYMNVRYYNENKCVNFKVNVGVYNSYQDNIHPYS